MSVDLLDWQARVVEARDRIHALVRETPVAVIEGEKRVRSARAYLKLEHLQTTGSFKLRGAANKVLSLSPELRAALSPPPPAITGWAWPRPRGIAELTPRSLFLRRSRPRSFA